MTKAQLEKKYGVVILDDTFVNPLTNKVVKGYKMYSADACPWEKGLPSMKAVEKECKDYEYELLTIKNSYKDYLM